MEETGSSNDTEWLILIFSCPCMRFSFANQVIIPESQWQCSLVWNTIHKTSSICLTKILWPILLKYVYIPQQFSV